MDLRTKREADANMNLANHQANLPAPAETVERKETNL